MDTIWGHRGSYINLTCLLLSVCKRLWQKAAIPFEVQSKARKGRRTDRGWVTQHGNSTQGGHNNTRRRKYYVAHLKIIYIYLKVRVNFEIKHFISDMIFHFLIWLLVWFQAFLVFTRNNNIKSFLKISYMTHL